MPPRTARGKPVRLALIAAGAALVIPLLASSGYSSNPPCAATCVAPSVPHGAYSTGAGAWPGMHTLRFAFGISSAYRSELDAAQANGMRAIVYIGGYNKTTCQFGRDDAWVRSHIAAILGHPAVRFYYIADEPHISTFRMRRHRFAPARTSCTRSTPASPPS